MVKFEELFVGFAIGALLIVSIFAFGITFQEDNNANETIADVPILNDTFTDLRTNLEDTRDKSQNQLNIFQNETPTTGFGSLILFSIVSSGKIFTGIIVGTYNLLIVLPTVVLGIPPVVTAVLSTIMIILFILGLWVLYKLGG